MSIGAFGCWAMRAGDYKAREFDGTAAGLTAAITYCGSNGVVTLYPGNSAVTVPALPAGVRVRVEEGGHVREYGDKGLLNPIINAAEYATFQAALDATPAGGRLYCPASAGPYIAPSAAGWTIDKSIEIFSDGPGVGEDKGFQYHLSGGAGNKDSTVFQIANGVNLVYIHDCVISNGQGPVSANGTGDAINYKGADPMTYFTMERVRILYPGRSAVRFEGTGGTGYGLEIAIDDCVFYGCRGIGAYFMLCNVVSLRNCASTINWCSETPVIGDGHGSGFMFRGCQDITLDNCVAEQNGDGLVNGTYDGYINFSNVHNGSIRSCHIEDVGAANVQNGIILNASRCITVMNNGVSLNNESGSIGVHLVNGTKGCYVQNNAIQQTTHAVKLDSASAEVGNFIGPQVTLYATAPDTPGKITLPTGGRNFAMLNNLTSGIADNKGVGILLPSMPNTSAIDSTVVQDGLLVYDSTNAQLRIRIGGAWKSVTVT